MTDPTPEERARRVWEHADDDSAFHVQMVHQIRAAVEVQKECDAKIAEAPRWIKPLYGESIADTVAFAQRCIATDIRAPKPPRPGPNPAPKEDMMVDLVKRAREAAKAVRNHELLTELADEIEELRESMKAIESAADDICMHIRNSIEDVADAALERTDGQPTLKLPDRLLGGGPD